MTIQQDSSKTGFETGSQANGARFVANNNTTQQQTEDDSIAADIKGVAKIYNPGSHDAHMALSEINLEIRSNEFFTLLGPSGCGKTTLLRELFQTPYFCLEEHSRHLQLATALEQDRAINHFKSVAAELGRRCEAL